jgi:hypothetical protein
MLLQTRGARIRLAAAAAALVGLLGAAAVRACEPCAELLDLDETAQQADLVVIGEQVNSGPSTGSGPDWIVVRVDEVLKGDPPGERIRVNGWDGMCPYGIVVEPGIYVMFLADEGEMYAAVNYGCAVKTLPVTGENVEVDEQSMPLDELAATLDLTRAPADAAPAATNTVPADIASTGTAPAGADSTSTAPADADSTNTDSAGTGTGLILPAVAGLAALGAGAAAFLLVRRGRPAP